MVKRLALILLLTIPSFWVLLKPGYYNMHDDLQLIRQLELEKCIYDGQIPCRWVPDLGNGYGYPLFNFYPPMPYMVGEIYRTLGASFITTVKLTAVTQIILASFAMYLLVTSLLGPTAGIIAAVFYTYAPYHAVNIYVRGAMDEAWATVFFPLLFYASYQLIATKKTKFIIIFALAIAGILLSHNPMVLIFTPFLLLWIFFWLISQKKAAFFIHDSYNFIKAGILGLGLSAFFTIPLLIETQLVQIESMFNDYYSYGAHFVTLPQLLFNNFWGDGPSVWGANDGFSFMLGYLHWIIPLILLIFTIIKSINKRRFDRKSSLIIFLVGCFLFSAFMTHNRSNIIWLIFSPIQKIQFPWRFLSLSYFFASFASAFIVEVLNYIKITSFLKKVIIINLLVSVIVINISYFQPVHSGPITDQQKFSGSWHNFVTGSIYDYLPKTAHTAPLTLATSIVDTQSPPNSSQITNTKRGTDWFSFNVTNEITSTLTVAQLYFPNFIAYDNQKIIPLTYEATYGRMQITLPPGNHQLYFKLQNTIIRTVCNYISFVSWLLIAFYFTKSLWPTLKKSKK